MRSVICFISNEYDKIKYISQVQIKNIISLLKILKQIKWKILKVQDNITH